MYEPINIEPTQQKRSDVDKTKSVCYYFLSVSTTPPPPTTPPPMVDDISCDFEVDFCNYTQATDDLFDWSRHRGPTESRGSGPDVDHTLGTALGMTKSCLSDGC